MFRKAAGSSATARWIVSTVLAVSAFTPAVTEVLPESAAGSLSVESVALAASPTLPGSIDPGVQLSRARDYMEQQRVAQQIEEDQERKKSEVETQTQKPEESAAKVTFTLKQVQTDPSQILTEEEIKKITDQYTGRKVSLQDLYDITDAINKIYEKKGYSICKAYLPPQRIHEGVVHISLLEGKTGNVTINGLRHTRKGYVANRIKLEPGKVANTDALTDRLQRFNATNDVQLRILVHAGEQPGTTDYEIAVFEPKSNHAATLYVDNAGYETSGRWREGVFYMMRSVTGQRDALRLNYLRSEGTNIFGANYSLPVNNLGTMLDFDYGANTTKITKGSLEAIGLKGHSYAAGITLRHPLRVDEKRRYEIGLQFLHQNSQTDITNIGNCIKVTDDIRNTYIPYISFTHYGKSSVLYHKHSLAFTGYNNLNNDGDNYAVYKLDTMYQKRLGGGQMLSARLNAQVASQNKKMSSSDMFYIGGINSVRGYEESFLSGSQGFNASLSWMVPLDKKRIFNAFAFFDYGRVFGNETTQAAIDQTLYSTGLGVTASYKNFYSSLTLGIPLKREFNSLQGKKVDRARIHFNCSISF
jgi:hemolysin activation/secretion protein